MSNPQQIPGKPDSTGAFTQLNDCDIQWTDPRGVIHWCAGSDVHPGVRLIWTLCERDVPAGEAWLLKRPNFLDIYKVCTLCLPHYNARKATKP